ncbi:hypothetical protein [Sphaerisporangium fuscum]|uniref:hypothetical protein n=1 Tax=Sphaerisporangium fuscum TaxID=2835868 RepID=UPI001BDC5640|nr:hypothetical protein [Sphaerisporangium fuscum]
MATPYSDPHDSAQETRRRVLEMAVLMRHGAGDLSRPGDGAANPQFRGATPAQAIEMFFAILQDRLPVWLRVLEALLHRAGKGRVNDNLVPVVRSGIDYYAEVLAAALPAFISPSITVRFREAMRALQFSPNAEVAPLARYLEAERDLGRVAPDVTPEASARLLLAGCFRHAYYELFIGPSGVPSRDEGASEIVREMRLETVTPRAPALS